MPQRTKKSLENITIGLMEEYFIDREKKLGYLSIEIPDPLNVRVRLDLSELFKIATGLRTSCGADRISIKTIPDIEAICVFGSVLYKHFPKEKKIDVTRKKYWLFGPRRHVRTITKPRDLPNDFDVMVITKENLADDKIIEPRGHFEGGGGDHYGHGGGHYVIDYSAANIIRGDFSSPFALSISIAYVKNLKVHVTYRSIEEFLSGIEKGDEISESVVRYGVPFVGSEKFNKIIKGIEIPKREPLHGFEYSERKLSSEGTCALGAHPKLYIVPPSGVRTIDVVELNGRII